MSKKIGVVLKMRINNLARIFYLMQGYQVEPGYDFSTAKHPQEKAMWNFAKTSFEYWKESK